MKEVLATLVKTDATPEETATRRERAIALCAALKIEVRERRAAAVAKTEGIPSVDSQLLTERLNRLWPNWLKERADFQRAFPRFAPEVEPLAETVHFVLRKTSEERTSEDTEALVAFLSTFPVLANLTLRVKHSLCRIVGLMFVGAGAAVFEEEERGHAFYMVLEGEVCITHGEDGVHTTTVSAGGAFCEQSLLSPGGSRCDETAVVDAGGRAVLLILRAREYRETISAHKEAQNQAIITFLQDEVVLFKNWSKHRLSQLSSVVELRAFVAGATLQRHAGVADEMYFLRRRSTCVSMCV